MNSITKIVLYFSFVILAPWLADAFTGYCDDGLCLHGYLRMGREYNNYFDKTCPPDAKFSEMTPTLQNLIVDQFNEKRNYLAGGNILELPEPACCMSTIKWDEELAELAKLDIKKCVFSHDCHHAESYHSAGMNVATVTYLKCNKATGTKKFIKTVGRWYDYCDFMRPSIIQMYPEFFTAPDVGHFTAMLLERDIAIGCAASTYCTILPRSLIVVCNFAYISYNGNAKYKTCKTPGKECKTGKNPNYPNLCSTSEKYDVNE